MTPFDEDSTALTNNPDNEQLDLTLRQKIRHLIGPAVGLAFCTLLMVVCFAAWLQNPKMEEIGLFLAGGFFMLTGSYSLRSLLFRWQLLKPIDPTEPAPVSEHYKVRFDDQRITTFYDDEPHEQIAWDDVTRVFISIQDEGGPFPYWGIGNEDDGVTMPNDAEGLDELMEELGVRLEGYACEQTYRTIIAAQLATEGRFTLWQKPSR